MMLTIVAPLQFGILKIIAFIYLNSWLVFPVVTAWLASVFAKMALWVVSVNLDVLKASMAQDAMRYASVCTEHTVIVLMDHVRALLDIKEPCKSLRISLTPPPTPPPSLNKINKYKSFLIFEQNSH